MIELLMVTAFVSVLLGLWAEPRPCLAVLPRAPSIEVILLAAIHADPDDETAWWALADHLEEQADPRAELLRLSLVVRHAPPGDGCLIQEERIRELLAAGVRPCVPILTNSIGMKMALVPAGKFLMGSLEGEKGRAEDEGPQHKVEITRPFYLGIHPVTQGEYLHVMGNNPSYFSSRGEGKEKVKGLDTSELPVEMVSYRDAVEFCKRLSAQEDERKCSQFYRLPTEAEWEHSCRAGARSCPVFSFGNSLSSAQANFNGNHPYGGCRAGVFLERTSRVGSFSPNAFGLSDMHGNVWEWCADWFDHACYAMGPRRDPPGPAEGIDRVLRGGDWGTIGWRCRSAHRFGDWHGARSPSYGFRIALSLSGEEGGCEGGQ